MTSTVESLAARPGIKRLFLERGFLILILLFWVPTLATITLSTDQENNHDERLWHLPPIRQIAEKWPAMNLVTDSFSASPPGYHWALAGVSKITGQNLGTLRLLNAGVGFLLIGVLYAWSRSRASHLDSTLLLAPLAASNFIIKSAAWVLTDNAGLLCAAASVLLALRTGNGCGSRIVASCLAAVTLLVRQINAWILVPLFVRNLFVCQGGGARDEDATTRFTVDANGILGVASLIIPVAALGWMFTSWQGLVPPQWRSANVGLSTCPQAYLFTLQALVLPFFLSRDVVAVRHWRTELPWVLAGALGGLGVSVATATSFDYESGRWGGYLWSVAQRLPVLWERSSFFVVLAPVGCAFVVLMWRAIIRRGRVMEAWVWISSVAAWAGSLVVCRQVFQRYFEPTVLIFALLGVVLSMKENLPRSTRFKLTIFTVAQVVITFVTVILPFV